ncbi:unnamed protein product [Rhizoctonia solani]|uniref:Uncharacterized protein n=1 Tax=Rhizoctonia solani TaxID=456999 RepID=A0A8H2X2V1_9AGAM|nr:unnamed protein product [Rhizoctonia solani]
MVFDATTKAFNTSKSTNDRSSYASASTPTPISTPPLATARPAKRRRTTQPRTMSSTPMSSPAPTPIVDLDALDAARRRAAGRVMLLWESLAQKYARPINDDDEIDILTGKICKDRGVLRSVSERGWKIGSFGEALEVEPLVLVSEGETETGASEADDEGDGEDDTEGEGPEDTEEGEVDPLGDWSYDWQYRVLPPPRPELSPQDAEDLKEFLAAENAIQENLRKTGKRPESDDDDIVYLGDSLHNTDGTLRDDETSDDEFASMALTDSSTIRYMKHEDDDDELDDVEPMASILGALALGRTPKKQTSHLSSPRPKDEKMDNNLSRSHLDAGSQASTVRQSTGVSLTNGYSGVDVDDDLIVIDSDSDDEPEPAEDSKLKSEILAGSFHQPSVPPVNTPASDVRSQYTPSDILATGSTLASTNSHSLAVRPTQSSRIPIANAASLPKPSIGQHCPPNIKRAPSVLPGSPILNSPTTKKCASKRVLGKSTPSSQTPSSATRATYTPLRGDVLGSDPTIVPPTPIRNESSQSLMAEVESCFDSSSTQAHANETSTGTTRHKATLSGTGLREKQIVTARQGPSSHRDSRGSKAPTSTPIASPSSSNQFKSPLKHRKKAVMVEVVLPIRRKTSKVKTESVTPSLSLALKGTSSATATTTSNERSYLQSNDSARGSEQLNPAPESSHPTVNSSLMVRPGAESGLKRKRSLGAAELTENTDDTLESRRNVGSVELGLGPCHPYCPPGPSERDQPVICCSTHSQHRSGLHSYTHTPHSAHTMYSTHHYPSIPVYQHQHQHQHLHTHLPYPLPQLPFNANELTEAAFKLIHGLSTFHQTSGANGSSGSGFWFPGAHLPFGFAGSGQAGPSSESLTPKLEESVIQEKISSECIPSSQEHERKAEALGVSVDEKPAKLVLTRSDQVLPSLSHSEKLAPVTPNSPLDRNAGNDETIAPSAATPPEPFDLNTKLPEREMSVIDIDSDSDDELAVCDAGAGSMRWEPPIKKEVDPDISDAFKKQPEPKKTLADRRTSTRTSPVKLKRMS